MKKSLFFEFFLPDHAGKYGENSRFLLSQRGLSLSLLRSQSLDVLVETAASRPAQSMSHCEQAGANCRDYERLDVSTGTINERRSCAVTGLNSLRTRKGRVRLSDVGTELIRRRPAGMTGNGLGN